MKKIITASSSARKLVDKAENAADMLSEFLDGTSRLDNLSDFLDEYDLEHIGKAMDALYDFAYMYAMDNGVG